MANPTERYGFKCIGNLAGSDAPQLWEGKMTVTTAVAKGDAIIQTSGQVDIAVSTSPQLLGVAAEAIAVTCAADDPILFYPALPWYLFEGQCSGTYAFATQRYVSCDIEGGTGAMEVNENGTTEAVITIVGEDPNDELGLNTMVHFIFLRSQLFQVLASK